MTRTRLWIGALGTFLGTAVATTLAGSCAEGGTGDCNLAECIAACRSSGRLGGECRGGACYCTDNPPGADADTDGDAPDDADVLDIPAEDAPVPDDGRSDDADTPDEHVVPDDTGTTEGSESGETTGEAKSACDPLACFMVCGGSCSIDGRCVCSE